MELKQIQTLLNIDVGASSPIIIANDYNLTLIYFYSKTIEKVISNYPLERNAYEDEGIAILTFLNVLQHKYGYPNDEVLAAHPYFSLGLMPNKIYKIYDSDLIKSLEEMNRIHRFHNKNRFDELNHYIIAFKDGTFECVADQFRIEFKPSYTLSKAITEALESLDSL